MVELMRSGVAGAWSWRRRLQMAFVVIALSCSALASAQYVDVLSRSAEPSPMAVRGLLNGLAQAGSRVIAVGQRGHVLFADEPYESWRQGTVPVSADLLAVHFPTPQHGWAVGHDGVVLHSDDAGVSWRLQLDGRQAVRLIEEYFADDLRDGDEAGDTERLAVEVAQFIADGADKSLLDVWFDDELTGFVVGAFGVAFRTEDGGRTWAPWFHHIDNPRGLHIYALDVAAGDLYAAGEQGLVLKLSRDGHRFEALNTPYAGTYFGVVGSGDAVLVYGLRGNVYRSIDDGLSWEKIDTGVVSNINGGTVADDGTIHLVTQTGQILTSRDGGMTFKASTMAAPMSASAVTLLGDTMVIAGRRGVRSQRIPLPSRNNES